MKELKEKGLTYKRIASELDLSPMTVYKHLKAEKRKRILREADGEV